MVIIKAPTADATKQIFQPYAIAMGELVYSWNHLQEDLAGLFWRLSQIENGAIAFAIWHSTANDHAQRSMLRAVAEVALAEKTEVRAEVVWLLDKIDYSLRHKRNDAIHAPLTLFTDQNGTTVIPYDMTNNPRADSLEGKEILKELIWYRETAEVLRGFCWQLSHSLHPARPQPLPQRPTLPHLGPQTTSKGKPQAKRDKALQPRRRSIREI
ncbi:hypothetical protein V1282_002452 [Nitrobacteraceae bacterium AZCC 2146]